MGDSGLDESYASKVGSRLRTVRRQRRLSLHAVEADSGHEFKASVLGAYERGERSISVPRLQRLAAIYGVPVDQLLPHDTPPPYVDIHPFRAEMGKDVAPVIGAVRSTGGFSGAVALPLLGKDSLLDFEGERITIDLVRLDLTPGPESDLLRRYLTAIQRKRREFKADTITIRGEDLKMIAALFDLSSSSMLERIAELGLSTSI